MSSIVVAGDTSGSITLQAPAVSGSTVLTLPTTSATLITDSSGILNIGSGQVYKDASGNVGIGVIPSPAQGGLLQLGNTSQYGFQGPIGYLNANIYFGTGAFRYSITGAASSYQQNSGYHIWSYAASGTANAAVSLTEAMRIDSSGNVGIGTSSPSTYAGKVVSYNNTNGLASFTALSGLAATSVIEIQDGAATPNRWWLLSGLGTTTDGTFSIYDKRQSVSRLAIDSSGNVGIGTTPSGTYKLEVTGAIGSSTTINATTGYKVAGAATSGQYLRGNGTNFVSSAIQAADVPTLNQNTTGNAANVTGTVAVGNGGTGSTTLPTNNVLLGNGTSALQAVAPSTSGNVLTSNGTTWQSIAPSGGGGGFTSMVVFTASGTWTIPAGITKAKVTIQGAGGGGGGGFGYENGGGGGATIKYVTGLTPGGTVVCTIGAGGSGAVACGANGGAGGTTSFGAYCSVTGGGAGLSSGVTGSGGVGTGGNWNLTGSGLFSGYYINTPPSLSYISDGTVARGSGGVAGNYCGVPTPATAGMSGFIMIEY